MWIVEAFDVFEDGHLGFGLGFEPTPGQESKLAKKLSAMALSKQSPTDPMEGRMPISRQRPPKAIEVYCEP